MPVRNIYLKIETIDDYCPVAPDNDISPPIGYKRDCMRNPGHEDGTIPPTEVDARRLTALVYREYLDPGFLVPKPDKLVLTDINEPAFDQRVPGAVIYARPGDELCIRVKNADTAIHSFHLHGLRYGIDSDGAFPFGTQSSDGRRSDAICPGQTWTYTFYLTDEMIGAWPFHDHYRNFAASINRGLFGGLIVLPGNECDDVPQFPLAAGLVDLLRRGFAPDKPAGGAARLRKLDEELPEALAGQLAVLDEAVRAPFMQPTPKRSDTLHIPLFFHVMSERGKGKLSSLCFNGRSFVGNSPTILAEAGQKIRWYLFNLDVGKTWHNFHPHGQRWQFAEETIDVRSLGPAESFVIETKAPPVLLLPREIEKCQAPESRSKEAKMFRLRGDFLFHCHSATDLSEGLVGLVRSRQTVWLTPAEAATIEAQRGLPLDSVDNSCPAVDFDRCEKLKNGDWEEVPNSPQVTFMHAVLLPNSTRVLFWGYGPQADQARIWDQATGAYSQPTNQPADISPDQNLWSGSQAYLNDAAGTILAFGGNGGGDTERRTFLFDSRPGFLSFSHANELNTGRFYTTAISLADGRIMTLFGTDTKNGGVPAASLEVFTPGGAGSWSAPKALPFNFLFYPWTFVLPNGLLFIAGPQKPARRFDWTVTPVPDPVANQFNQVFPQRGVNMDGTAVLLPLRPPNYEPRVLIAGGNGPAVQQSAEWIDLSAATPAWQSLAPGLNIPRDKLTSVLLPDGQVIVVGGAVGALPDGGPVETFDPENPAAGFRSGPSMAQKRDYHSAALLLADGSVLVGGDPTAGGVITPHERYLPPYFFAARPVITSAPATVAYGANFTVNTPQAGNIAEVVLMRPGAVTHAFNMAQRYVGCAIVSVGGTSIQATAPPNGNVAPPGYYLLFAVDADRVPSMGKWIKLG